MKEWFPSPEKPDDPYAQGRKGNLGWLKRSTSPLANDGREFLNRNLSALPEGCQKGISDHLHHERHHTDGFFELIVGRTLQEVGADIEECEPINLETNRRPDFVARFPEGTLFVEAVSPVLDRELTAISSREALLEKLIEDNVPPGWAADIRALPEVGPNESKRPIRAFLQREMDIPPPNHDDEEVEIRETFEQGSLRIILFPQSRHGLSAHTKIAKYNVKAFFPNDQTVLRGAVQRKYAQLRNLAGTTLVALNMSSMTSELEDLDQALFGVPVSQGDQYGSEIRRYFQRDGLFAGGEGEPTISGVLAFPKVGFWGCADPILYVHPRFGGSFPRPLDALEIRTAPGAGGVDVNVRQPRRTDLLRGLGFVKRTKS